MTACPPVATVLPTFDLESYDYVKEKIADQYMLRDSHREYLTWAKNELVTSTDKFHPIVLTKMTIKKIRTLSPDFSFDDLTRLALSVFQEEITNTVDRIIEFPSRPISSNYILVQVNEIGIDKANDIATISYNTVGLDSERQEFLIRGERMKFEYAIALGSAYCLSRQADVVYFYKNEDYKWK
jgi:hypothetical protein